MYVFIFSTNFSKIFHILRRNEADVIKIIISLHPKNRLVSPVIMKLEFFWPKVKKYSNTKVYENPSIVGTNSFHAEIERDR